MKAYLVMRSPQAAPNSQVVPKLAPSMPNLMLNKLPMLSVKVRFEGRLGEGIDC